MGWQVTEHDEFVDTFTFYPRDSRKVDDVFGKQVSLTAVWGRSANFCCLWSGVLGLEYEAYLAASLHISVERYEDESLLEFNPVPSQRVQ